MFIELLFFSSHKLDPHIEHLKVESGPSTKKQELS